MEAVVRLPDTTTTTTALLLQHSPATCSSQRLRVPLCSLSTDRSQSQSLFRPASSTSSCIFRRRAVRACVATGTESSSVKVALKAKGQDLRKDLKGTCLFLIGMMGSGKSTVGKIVADALGYYFFDSDKLVEQAAGGASVAQIFKEGNEESFRDAETEVLAQLTSMARLVVATGGGAVVRPTNWGYLNHGITVWLDVPLAELAKRVVAAGPDKRPLLGLAESETAYGQALSRLTQLFEERGAAYANADVTVCVQKIAAEMGVEDVKKLTPSMIAYEVVQQVHALIRSQRQYRKPTIGL